VVHLFEAERINDIRAPVDPWPDLDKRTGRKIINAYTLPFTAPHGGIEIIELSHVLCGDFKLHAFRERVTGWIPGENLILSRRRNIRHYNTPSIIRRPHAIMIPFTVIPRNRIIFHPRRVGKIQCRPLHFRDIICIIYDDIHGVTRPLDQEARFIRGGIIPDQQIPCLAHIHGHEIRRPRGGRRGHGNQNHGRFRGQPLIVLNR